MGYDDNADVATLIGYASRKLGRYDEAKLWYDRALAADPNHALTWSYYGMWQAEQGNVLKAKDDLAKVESICGTGCREYAALKQAIDGTMTLLVLCLFPLKAISLTRGGRRNRATRCPRAAPCASITPQTLPATLDAIPGRAW